MRVLLDECLPRRLRLLVEGHDCRTVAEMGWAGTKNGVLLELAQQQFDVFLSSDRNLCFQQDLSRVAMAVAVLVAHSNRFEALRNLVPALLEVLAGVRAGEVVHIA